ncbi:MAG: monovalent cation/H+ antiporter subunit D [Hahellaceae bacterium]|nr:monovalent cation/H+ antiporter subunit D [Hahellaceae bacterium]
MLTAVVLMFPGIQPSVLWQRMGCGSALILTMAVVLSLLNNVRGVPLTYVLGDWQPPFGIVLTVDPLAILLVLLTVGLALVCWLYSLAGKQTPGPYYHSIFLFQIMGINGAFLTGDLFNLFVFFEILLIASYSLLTYGSARQKARAHFHYVALNLIGSAFFLFALGILYGATGTLNMADMSQKLAQLSGDKLYLAKAGGLLLIVVFGLKAALVPLQFWLVATYSAALAPVAALFAIMTKVGIYSFIRVHVQLFGGGADGLQGLADDWLWYLSLITLLVGSIGMLASEQLKPLIANLVIISVGLLLMLVSNNSVESIRAAVYYLIHSTLITAALFLLADMIALQRGQAGDRLVPARPLSQPLLLGGLLLLAAMVVIGLPPFSGFIGKLLALQAFAGSIHQVIAWAAILLSSLFMLIMLARAGTGLIWHTRTGKPGTETAAPVQLMAVVLLLGVSAGMVVAGEWVLTLSGDAAWHVFNITGASPGVGRMIP